MNYGRFFALDLEASRVEDGIGVFNYIDLIETRVSGKNRTTPVYPIFVTITPTSVKFILQFCVYKIENDEKFYFSVPQTGGKIGISHLEEVLIELPLKDSKGSSLSSVVKHLYSSVFPISRNDQKKEARGYIEELIARRYEQSINEDSQKVTYDILRERDSNDISYSSLFIWDLMSKNGGNKKFFKLFDEFDNRKNYVKVLRKLLLDFFFDIVHCDVFKNSVHYDDVYKILMEDFFCSSIIRKSEFYYQRELINKLAKDEKRLFKDDDNIKYHKKEPQDSVCIYAEYFDKAEEEWINCIQDNRSDKEFEFIPQWFENSRKENNDFITSIIQWTKKKVNSFLNFIYPSFSLNQHSWFVPPELELKRVYFRLRDCKDKICCSRDFATACRKTGPARQLITENDELEDLNSRRQASSLWLFKRYDFADAFRLSLFPSANAVLCLLLAFILYLLMSRNFHLDILGGVERGINWLINKDIRTTCEVPKIIKLGLFSLIGVISAIILGKSIAKSRLAGWRDSINSAIIFMGLVCSVILLAFLAITISKWFWIPWVIALLAVFKIRILKNALSYMHFTFPRLIASISAAWLTVALSEDLYKAFFDSQWSIFSTTILLLLIFIFVLYEVNKIVPHINSMVKIFRSLEMMMISFAISIFVGIIIINFTGEKFLARSGYLPEYYRDNILLEHKPHTGKDDISIDLDSVDWREYVEKYTLNIENPDSLTDSARINQFIKAFADTKYESEYIDRIAIARDSYMKYDGTELSDTTKGKFLLRHENSLMFKDMLQHLKVQNKDNEYPVANYMTIQQNNKSDGYRFFILYDFLIQFAVVAMFIGIFIQMIFEEKNITEN